MARFLFVSWGGAGNQTPAIGLASELVARGHRVTFAGYLEQRVRFERLGFGFRVLRTAQDAWPAEPPDDWMPVLVDAVWACPAHLDDLPEVVAAGGYDVVVIDCLMFGALAAAERLPVPAVVLVHSAPGAMVPPGGGLDLLALDRVNAVRSTAGLGGVATLWETWLGFPTLCTSLRELDPLAGGVPAEFEYVGPVLEPHTGPDWVPPWPADDTRPLVVVSFSTGQAWDQAPRIRRTVEALEDGLHRVLVTTGVADVAGLETTSDVVLVPYLHHAAVLPHAAATVTHAGHGTVAASLAHGVPLVCLPNLAADQPALAAQLERIGAGRALDGDAATPGQIAAAVREVLTVDCHRAEARRLAEAIATLPGVAGAVDRLEAASRPPVGG